MSLTVPVAVRLFNKFSDRHVTNSVESLSYRIAIPGGFASASVKFAQPLRFNDQDASPYTHGQFTDRRTGAILWQGRIEDPTPTVSNTTEVWDLTLMGPSARAQDQSVPRMYIDSTVENWYALVRNGIQGQAEVSPVPDNDASSREALLFTVGVGSTIANKRVASFIHDLAAVCGQELGGFAFTRKGGKADAGWNAECHVQAEDGTPADQTILTANLTIGPTVSSPFVYGADFTGGDTIRLSLFRDGGATTVADDDTWLAFYSLYVAARRQLADGSFAAGSAHDNDYVFADEVVGDLLGSGLLPYDGATAVIRNDGGNDYEIDQLLYIDGVTPAEILDDLMTLKPDYFWAAWEGDLPRFEWTTWPKGVAYEVSIQDGYEAPNSTVELYNQVSVRWRTKRGRTRTTLVTATVSALDDQGLVRRAIIDLADEVGSSSNAQQVGEKFLAEHAYPPNGGTVKIGRPILNLITGRIEQPWEIRPGRLVRIRDLPANPDALNPEPALNGSTVVRLTATEYDASANEVTCELDNHGKALLKVLSRSPNRQRRR